MCYGNGIRVVSFIQQTRKEEKELKTPANRTLPEALNVRLPTELLKALQREALHNERSVSGEVRIRLLESLKTKRKAGNKKQD